MLSASSFPYPVHILVAHSYMRKNDVIVAASEHSMFETFKDLYQREPDSIATKYMVGNIIDLPSKFVERIKLERYKTSIGIFQCIMCDLVTSHFLKFGKPPPHTKLCSCFPDDRSAINEYDLFPSYIHDDGENKIHDECGGRRFVLTDSTWDALFALTNEPWANDIPKAGPDFNRSFYIITSSGSDGNIVEEVTDEEYLYGGLLFAMVGQEQTIPAALTDWTNGQNELHLELRRSQDLKRIEDRKTERAQYLIGQYKKLGLTDEEIAVFVDKL